MKRILLTGSNGLLGQNLISQIVNSEGFELLATSASANKHPVRENYHFIQADLTDHEHVNRILDSFSPDVIIHTAAMTQVDPCEKDPLACRRINVEATRNLAGKGNALGAHFIYLSTDFVFDGEGGPYKEDDKPNPLSIYGQSKLEGEYLTIENSSFWSIIRTILVYGITPSMSRSNLVLWVRDSLSKNQAIKVVDDQFRMPTLVDDLANGIMSVVEREKSGIYHLSGPEMTSMFDFSLKVARFFDLDESLISPISSRTLNQSGKRPPTTGFVLEKARKDLDYRPLNIHEGLVRMKNLLDLF